MAKKSIIAREKKKQREVSRCSQVRKSIKEAFKKATSFEERIEAANKLHELPRNASPSRGVKRCRVCGRPKGVFRKFGLCRIHLREAVNSAKVPGCRKASW